MARMDDLEQSSTMASSHAHDSEKHGHANGGLRHALSEFFGRHSHDHAESLDDALESSKAGTRALAISFSALMVTALVQMALVSLWARSPFLQTRFTTSGML